MKYNGFVVRYGGSGVFYYICPHIFGPRSTTDSIEVSEAFDSGSIPDEATIQKPCF
jgi:hypothetical protein